MTVVYYKLRQEVTLIAATIVVVISLLEQMNTYLGTFYAAIDLANAFFSLTVCRTSRSSLL